MFPDVHSHCQGSIARERPPASSPALEGDRPLTWTAASHYIALVRRVTKAEETLSPPDTTFAFDV